MPAAPPAHHSRVLLTPWPGVHATELHSGRHFGRHWHATHGVGLLDDGAQRSASGRGMVDAHAGDVITTNPGEVHDGRPLGGPARRWRIVYFEPGVIGTANAAADGTVEGHGGADVELARPVLQDAPLRATLQRLFDRLDRWQRQPRPAEALACDEALAQLCGQLLARHCARPGQATAARDMAGCAAVRQVRDRLADELMDPPGLTALAAMVGLSKTQLLRRFARAYGVPPHAWLLLQRAERARSLIRGGSALAEAAAACGFADQSHLTRLFVRQFGYTPGAWQQAVRRAAAAA